MSSRILFYLYHHTHTHTHNTKKDKPIVVEWDAIRKSSLSMIDILITVK